MVFLFRRIRHTNEVFKEEYICPLWEYSVWQRERICEMLHVMQLRNLTIQTVSFSWQWVVFFFIAGFSKVNIYCMCGEQQHVLFLPMCLKKEESYLENTLPTCHLTLLHSHNVLLLFRLKVWFKMSLPCSSFTVDAPFGTDIWRSKALRFRNE